MIRLIAVVCLAVVAMAMPYDQELDSEWLAFQRIYKKNYTTDEEPLRRLIWEDNVQYIEKHNLQADIGLHKFWLGMNEYGDMLLDEFVSVMNGYKGAKFSQCGHFYPAMNVQLPDEVDWRTKGYVTPVKNQGQCGSCWSFSATGSLEGQHFRKTGNLVDLSEKNLMDCSRAEGNHGCDGGMMDQAFEYVIKNKGIDTEASYPYEPRDGPCRFKRENVGATEDSCKDIEEGSESDLQSAVATQGPISVAIDAGHSSFQLYKSGIYEEPKCSSSLLDHGVLVVGYGSENNQDYWLVKNSWGTVWGMQGYIKMARNEHNMCGIATKASFPIV